MDRRTRAKARTEINSRCGSNRHGFTYSEDLGLAQLSFLDEHTQLGHVLVEPLGKLIASQRRTVLALERLSQGSYYVLSVAGGLGLHLWLGGGHVDEREEMAEASLDGAGLRSYPLLDSHVCYVSHFYLNRTTSLSELDHTPSVTKWTTTFVSSECVSTLNMG